MRFLVTAGSTREKIDAVRFWTNIFTGNTGLNIARALTQLGQVDLLTSNRDHLAELSGQQDVQTEGFSTYTELRELLEARMQNMAYDAVFMSAAVSDYRPIGVYRIASRQWTQAGEQWIVHDVGAEKVKGSHGAIAVLGEHTEKLVDLFRSRWNYTGMLVKFKLEVGVSVAELIRLGQASRLQSKADYLLANTLEMVQGQRPGAYLLSDRGEEWVPRKELPARMVRLVQEHQAKT